MPFAVVAVMGISGAFLTTSMQNASKSAPRTGYISNLQGVPCKVEVACSDNNTPICFAGSKQAFGLNNNCTEILHMP